MRRQTALRRQFAVMAFVGVAVLACTLQSTAAPTATPAASTDTATVAAPQASATTVPTDAATATSTATQGPPPVVTVSATGGRLNVRRGPGPEYDFVGAFLDGQSTTVTARNADAKWVLINVPNTSKSLGWITLETQYTSVNGDVTGLPLMQVGPAVPAYIRNCTGREMMINPLGALLQPKGSAPENQLQFFPGEYSIIDMETEASVGDVTVIEGRTIDIKEDSSGTKYSC
jgi:hypothetical protein